VDIGEQYRCHKTLPQLEIKSIQLEAIDESKSSNHLSTHYEKNQKKEFLSLGVSH
jgi:hypothetical protein